MKVFGYADVGRAGLGNSLFPWARCVLWCDAKGVPMLPPRWVRLRVGPYLRRELDTRSYHRYFVTPSLRARAEREIYLLLAKQYAEQNAGAALELTQKASTSVKHAVVKFEGMGDFFASFAAKHELLREALTAITRPAVRPAMSSLPQLAIHVRRGDFTVPSGDDLARGIGNRQLDIRWYLAGLRAVRDAMPNQVLPAIVYSDGNDDDLALLLSEPRVTRAAQRPAVNHLLAMAGARALIASGSTFSRWASFLGQMPTLWFPGQRRQLLINKGESWEPEWQSGQLPGGFLQALVSHWR